MAGDYDYEDLPSPWKVPWSWVNPLQKSIRPLSISRVIMRTITVGSLAERASSLTDADLALHPPVSRFGIFDCSAIEAMADEAEAYTLEVLDESGFAGPVPPNETRSGDKGNAQTA